ncbi:CHAT domain-containing protein [Suillus clintonianus]|uniref:CHAT domain-containing protein n=1 Tax=Suillus clintonianus TaxID=1904413 RepID=UPI001B886FD8|nr:CHAT domain-containing protein [Suillus clintonianus]KAG2125776.1 CHAT domain-containing protein [Suillus clintonianus]
MPSSAGIQSIRLEIIGGNNLQVPSWRQSAGIYISINVDSRRHWKSAISVLSSDESVAWGDTVTLPQTSPALSVEIWASFELDRMLGNGEIIAKLQISWNELLDNGDEPFTVRGVMPSLTLKAAVINTCDIQDGTLFDSIVDCEIAQATDAGHARYAEYRTSKMVSYLNDAIERFQLARLEGYIRNDLQDIDTTISLFCEARAVHIHESLQLCCKLLLICPEGTYLRSLGADSEVNYAIGECNDLPVDVSDEGIRLQRVVLELCPLGQKYRPKTLHKLSKLLITRFRQWGSIDDIDESIRLRREAVFLCPKGHSDCGTYLNDLASSLESRFNHQGKSHDLDEVISLHEEALLLRPVWHRKRDFSVGNLGGALRTRFNKRGDIKDIARAISLYREALILHPPGHPRRDTMLNNLALALTTRYGKMRVIEDLNEAIDLYRESLRLTQLDDPQRYATLGNLSSALGSRFTRTQKHEDVEEAIRLCQESLVALPSLHPDRCLIYWWLQVAYLSRYQMEHNPGDLSLAVNNFRLASGHPTQGFPRRIKTTLNWVHETKSHQHESALEAYKVCLELFDNHVMTRSSIISRREAATDFAGAQSLPGRGQQWSLASRLRTPLEELKSASLQLAQTLADLRTHLSDAQSSTGSTDRAAADRAATDYRRLTRQWEAAVAEIRNIRGFSRFLLSSSYTELQAAARHGPVIILIAREPHHVHFPRITLADLKKLKNDFAKEIRQASFMHAKEPRKDLRVLLRTVWDHIMLPIVNVLQRDLKLQRRSRIWLCPTAAFTSIPLHAAHPFRTKADYSGKEPCLEDLYICSYTPTPSALIRARQMMKTRVTQSFAAIGQSKPGVGQGMVLATVDSELELVHTLVPPEIEFTSLSGDEATQAGSLNALQCNNWVHLACHGKQDRKQPYNSRFAMKDKPLTLLDIMEKDIPHAEFAFLSACHTAAGDEKTPDEVIHLAAGLHFSGFKSVIGTLWAVDDAVAKHVVEAFYEKMFEGSKDGGIMDCTKAAQVLNHATDAVKMKVPLEQRIVFIHIGV